MQDFVLASSSPRRREILSALGIAFMTAEPNVDESLRDGLPAMERVVALAEDKARAVFEKDTAPQARWILAADTLVYLPEKSSPLQWPLEDSLHADRGKAMGKPRSRADAEGMIRDLAGREHVVFTGMALLDTNNGQIETARSESIVSFASLSPAEIDAYLDFGDWEGVAGAYRIQGRAALHIERIVGSWSGIVGLPIRELYVILEKSSCPALAPKGK